MPNGRFAPSPTGSLHLGNLRTALVAWLCARSSDSQFVVRMEDLDAAVSRREHEVSQLKDLGCLGLDWDGVVVRQSGRFSLYGDALARLVELGLVYECFCTRREIQEASRAPNGAMVGIYPGTCRELSSMERAGLVGSGRPPALRLRAGVSELSVCDELVGMQTFSVDDVVLRRNDGVYAYNLAVVVDDELQGIEQVVRGDDLLSSTPSQMHLGDVLGFRRQQYVHVPLTLSGLGQRLAKRDGAVSLGDRRALGETTTAVLRRLATSLGFENCDAVERPADLIAQFTISSLSTEPWVFEG